MSRFVNRYESMFEKDDRQFYWMSTLDAVHTRNIAERPEVGIVIFDSTVLPYHGRAVYISSVLCPRAPRQPCELHGIAKDHRTTVM